VRALEMAPRLSGGSLTPWLAGSVSLSVEAPSALRGRVDCRGRCGADRDPLCPDYPSPFVQEIRVTEGHSFRARLCNRIRRVRRRDRCPLRRALRGNEHDCDRGADHHAIDARSVLGTVQGSSLRSARAHARPAGLDGACAQILSWPLRDGRRCDNSQLDRSWPLTAGFSRR
jgi:hypothetical protein